MPEADNSKKEKKFYTDIPAENYGFFQEQIQVRAVENSRCR